VGSYASLLYRAQVPAGAASVGDVLKVKELLEKHTPCTAQDYSFAFGGAGRTRRGGQGAARPRPEIRCQRLAFEI